tara:strand:+ start:135 stop:311 length:177 start_codon:yes stop_codon:yes gene_type:complete
MIELEDLKVVGANVLCFITINNAELNIILQTILFLATIIYTLARTLNEYKKYKATLKK